MIIEILRHRKNEEQSYLQTFEYEAADEKETVATMLNRINLREDLTDKIAFRQSCLQKKCGACAMLINGRPGLACAAKLADLGDHVKLEPLKKFPVIDDLIVDRSIMTENLKLLNAYLDGEAIVDEKRNELSYEASRCLQCGCCLEVCPNFMSDEGFTGLASAMILSRLINETDKDHLKRIAKDYSGHFFAGCGKSLACQEVCPADLKVEDLLVNSNAIAIWKRYRKD